MAQASGIGCFPISEKKTDSENKDAEKEKTSILLRRSFLQEKTQAWEDLEKKKRKEIQETQTNEIKRFPYPSFIFEKKPNFMEVFYVNIPGTKRTKKLLLDDLPKRWTMPPPDAIISITGIDHQFNIKDKYNLKRDLIDAVISTGSWVVTCGTESKVVRFIEEAVNEHVAIKNRHIPIVGILSQRVHDEMKIPGQKVCTSDARSVYKRFTSDARISNLKGPINNEVEEHCESNNSKKVLPYTAKEKQLDDTIAIRRRTKENWCNVPNMSTKEVLDPIHTQFIFAEDLNEKQTGSTATCRDVFENFLMNINNKKADCEAEIYNDEPKKTEQEPQSKCVQWETKETLPVVLVVIEGGIDALKTALSVLRNNYHVVVIDGSGGAANYLSSCYRRSTSSNLKSATVSDFDKYIRELENECCEDDPKDLKEDAKELIKFCLDMLKNDKLIHIHVYSLEKKHTKVTGYIQDAISNMFKDYYEKEIGKASGSKNKYELKINAVKKQLKLVEKWKRHDIAEREIFISKNRAQLTCLQTLDEKRMSKLPGELIHIISEVMQKYEQRLEGLTMCNNQFKQNILKIKEENKTHNYEVFSTAHHKLIRHVDHMPVEYIKRYKKELYEIRSRYIALQNEADESELLDELPRMTELQDHIKRKMREFTQNYAFIINNLSASYEKFKKSVLQFEEVNKKPYYSALRKSFYKLVGPMPDDINEKLKKKFQKIEKELDDKQTYDEKGMTELYENIEKIMEKNKKIYADVYEKFKKDVLQFKAVQKEPYYSPLKKSFYKLVSPMPDDDCDIFKKKFQEIEFDDRRTHMTYVVQKIDFLKEDIEQFMAKNKTMYDDVYKTFKNDVLQCIVVNKANYFMDKNKAKYFTNVSTSLRELMISMENDFGSDEQDEFRVIIQTLVDEYEKDAVSELFQSTLIANRTDFVILIMDKIEHMSAFVLGYLPNVFRLCIDSDDDAVIQLIDQHWDKFRNSEKQREKDQEERQINSTEFKEITTKKQRHTEQTDLKNAATERKKKQFEEIADRLRRKKDKKNNRVLLAVNNFIIDLFEDTEFKLYNVNEGEEIDLIYKDKPFHHLFVWAVLVNSREMAMIFWELETDHTCAALFASAVLNELAEKALFSKHMHHSASLKENAGHFETLACNLMTELYSTDRESALKTLVTKVGRFNSTPLKIAVSQKLKKFMAHTACQAQLNSIWSGDIAVYTPAWKIGMIIFLPILLIQSMGFIIIKPKKRTSKQISPGRNGAEDQGQNGHADQNQNRGPKPSQNRDPKLGQNRDLGPKRTQSYKKDMLYCAYRFYCAPVTKFVVYMITYMAFVVIFAIFVLTDLYPLSESPPSILEYLTWVWTLSLAIEEIRQILQTNKGSLSKNLKFWAKDFWNIFDMLMYILFLLSVVLRYVLTSEDFYFARMSYAVTLSMFILRSMHFFFIQRYIGPKVVMIGRMLGDLGLFIALYALFLFSFGIMYQAILFPNSVSSPWEMLKNLVFLPYWQLYGELNLEQIEGAEPSKCTNDPQLYTNGTIDRCPESSQFNMLMPAVYLVLTNILLVNIVIAIFSQTFQNVQNNSEMIYKFHMYALVYEYHDRPMFPIPIVIHLWRIIVFCYYKIKRPTKYGGAFVHDAKPEEIEKLHILEKSAYETLQNGPYYTRNKYDAMKMMTDERDILKEIDSTPTQQDIKDLRLEIHRMRESLIQEIQNLEYQKPVIVLDNRR